MDHDAERKVQRERRYQSVVLSLCAAGMVWVLQALLSFSADMGRVQERIASMDMQLSLMYRASDARRDIADVSARIAASERRIERLELDRREARKPEAKL